MFAPPRPHRVIDRPIRPPGSQYVTFVSSDDFEFVISRQIAMQSAVLEQMIEGDRVRFGQEFMHAGIVFKLCTYLLFKWKYRQGIEDVPKFDVEDGSAMHLTFAAHLLRV